MEKKISEEQLIMIYKELYFSRGNSEKCIDFNMLVDTYKIYLGMFFDNGCTFYSDIAFLEYVVDGFNYIYRSYIEDEKYDASVLHDAIINHHSELSCKCLNDTEGEANYTNSDLILVYSMDLVIMFMNMDLVREFYDKIQKIFFNTYVIENSEKGRGENGMESRKCYS